MSDRPDGTELAEQERVDRIEELIGKLEAGGSLRAGLLRDLLHVWKKGTHPDGKQVRSDSARQSALKLLLGELRATESEQELVIALRMDAEVLCSSCGKKMLADARVKLEDVRGMWGGEEE